jgi:adenine-specific DNA methylase
VSAKDFETHFREVLAKAAVKGKVIAVSFNDSSWADADKVKGILSDYKPSVEVVNMDYEYKYRKERTDAVEYLFVAR